MPARSRSPWHPAVLAALGLIFAPLSLAAAADEDLAREVEAMARVGGASSPSFSPDGTRLALVSNLAGLPQVWTVPSEGGWPDLVTALADPVGAVEWSPDGAWLAFTVAPGGGMNEQVYVVRPDGRDLRRLTRGGKETNRFGGWTRDGRELTLGSNERTGAAIDAFVRDVASGATRGATRAPGINAYSDVSPDGRSAILSRLVSRGDVNLFLVNWADGREALLTPHDGPGSFGRGRFSPDGRTIYLYSNQNRDKVAFARVRLDTLGHPGPIEVMASREDAELQAFEIDQAGTTAALLWNVAGRSALAFVDLATSRETPGPELPAEVATGVTFSPDGRLLALTLAGAAHPQDIWVLERANGRLRQVTRSPHAGVDLSALVSPSLVRFPAHDGLELSGWLYRPRGASGAGPLVLSFHGGPEAQERPLFRSDYQALLARGISVFAPNVRGSFGFGKHFVNLDNGALRFDGLRDIEACLAFVIASRLADPKRIGIMGGSYGGYMTMAGLTEYPSAFAAGVNLFGVVNFATFFAQTQPWMAAISKVEYGDPDTQADLLKALSPIHKVDRVVAPTLVLHGANDTNVPVAEAEQVVESLKRRGVPVEYVLFPDEGHGFRKIPNRVRSTTEIVRWFDRYLNPR